MHRTVEIRLDYEDRAKEVTKSVTDTVILGNPGFDQEEIEKVAARAIQRLIMEGPGNG
jgi:hypothetical protein